MQMINVLQKLAQLDANNPNVSNPLAAGQKKVVEADQIAQLPELKTVNELRALSGLKPVAECAPFGMPMEGEMSPMGHPRPPASFSINATAADGAEVSAMLGDILNLAGVHKVGQEHMPAVSSPQTSMVHPASPEMGGEKDAMRSALDAMNEPPEDEGHDMSDFGVTDEEEMPLTAEPAMGSEPQIGMGATPAGMGGGSPEMQSMADEIRGMADKLSQIDDIDELPGVDGGSEEEKADEAYDNTPADPTNVPLGNTNNFAYNPNAGGMNKGMTNMPSATLEDQLYSEYKRFVNEAKASCCCEEKGKKACPVHGKKKANEGLNHSPAGPKIEHADVDAVCKCAHHTGVPLMHEDTGCVMDCMSSFPKFHKHITHKYNECWEDFHQACCDHYSKKHGIGMPEQLEPGASGVAGVGVLPEGKKTMSQAAKGNEKYGKKGMQALAKAGREGKDLDKVRDKYNKYDEAVDKSLSKAAKTVKKGALHKQEGIPQDKKIGTAKLKSLKKSGTPLEKKRANFALNIQGKGKK